MRLVNDGDDRFWPPGQTFPNGEMAFQLSTPDKEEGERRGREPLASVWDYDLTTVAEAKAFRPGKPTRACWLWVHAVCSVAPGRLRVLADPRPATDGPGAEGHCGIAGLHPLPEESGKRAPLKGNWKEMMDRLAQQVLVNPPRASQRESASR